jgi:hypothetical protein
MLADDDIEAAKAMLANPDIGVTQIPRITSARPRLRSIAISPPREPRVPSAFERGGPQRSDAPGWFGQVSLRVGSGWDSCRSPERARTAR